ncbi:MAG: DNA polymerase III subunit gamma/tau, partial [Saprospiraceae bacterium]|nr:DNA polymerase III subunit gamma/tau [Saprospiraceae bacterium]
EHVRALIEQVRFQPQQGDYKVFIIDEVHMLSQQAFNAFLKTLEEPPSYAIFILATTEKHRIIPTILSRCQIFDFRRIQASDMVAHLEGICEQEGIKAERDALHVIAQKADGALRDALSIFDRMVAFSGKEITYSEVIDNLNVLDYDYYFRLVEALLLEDVGQVLRLLDEVLRKGFDADIFINGFAEHIRNLLVCKDPQTLELLEVGEGLKERYRKQADISSQTFLLSALNLANECDLNYKMARNKRLHVEMALIKMTYLQRLERVPIAAEPSKTEKKTPESKVEDSSEEKTSSKTGKEEKIEEKPEKGSDAPEEERPAVPAETEKKPHLPRLKRLDDVLEEVKEDDANGRNRQSAELTLEAVREVWSTYLEKHEQKTVRQLLADIDLELKGLQLIARVGTSLVKNALRQETELMERLRDAFHQPELSLIIKLDKSLAPDRPKRKKPLTDMEKFQKLHEKNPLIREAQKRFNLRFDGE